jgi:hypothetical protein
MIINVENYKKLKKAYDKAVANKQNQFEFQQNTLLVSYAKYLLEHLRNVLNIKHF